MKVKFVESPLGKVILEALRWGVLAFVSVVIDYVLKNVGGLDQTTNIVMLTAVLRFIDSILHKSVAEKGLVRF